MIEVVLHRRHGCPCLSGFHQVGVFGGFLTRVSWLRRDMQAATSDFGFRSAVRSEQELIYRLAADSNLESNVISALPRPERPARPRTHGPGARPRRS